MRPSLRCRIRAIVLAAPALLALTTTYAHSQSIDDRLWGTDGTVNTLAKSGNTLYLGGDFFGVRPDKPHGWSRWNLTTEQPVLPIPSTVNLQVNEIESDGLGGWYLGGDFRKVGGLSRTGLARVLADGTVASFNVVLFDAIGTGPGTVDRLRRVGGTLYFAGDFTHVNGVSRPHVAAVNANTGALLSWAPPVVERIDAMEVGGGKVYLAGRTGILGGLESVIAVDAASGVPVSPTFPVIPTSPSTPGQLVDVLKLAGNTLYAAGLFDSIGGVRRYKVAAFNATTGGLLPWDPAFPGPNLRVLDIEAGPGAVYVAGYTVKPVFPFPFRPFLNARNPTTGGTIGFTAPDFDTTVTTGVTVVNALKLSGSTLYVSGNQKLFGPPFMMPVVSQLDPLTGALTPTYSPVPGLVYDIELDGPVVAVAGGGLDGIEPTLMPDLAALDITTGMPPAPSPVFEYAGPVQQVQLLGSSIFTNQSGTLLSRDAASGTYNASFYPLGPVHSLVTDGLSLYAGGEWDDAGTTRGFVTKVDPVTMLEVWSVSDFDDVVTALAFANSKLYVAGGFQNVLGEFRERGAALDADGTLDPDWQPVYAIAPRLLVADASGVYAALPGNSAIANNPDSGTFTGWEPTVTGEVYALALSASRVYLGGLFSAVNFNPAGNLAAVDKSFGSSVTWNVSASGQVNALLHDGTDVYIGGEFQSITVTPPAPHRDGITVLASTAHAPSIVRIMESELPVAVDDPARIPGTLALSAPFPNPANDRVHLHWTLARETSVSLDLFDVHGRRVRSILPRQTLAAGAHQAMVPLGGLGAGLYFARLVDGLGATAVRTITVMR